ncbi:ABC transporter substrate-binding protein [Anaeromyxobacter dehalogenans]|uniref:Amino acid/amide ABC transporter substrate-binding protein, HAAT family n=1 Tax=Anaeromyxobacter dehalogenans (strain 2CP-C) TaxID=290397 RepID=Q2IJX2_ANADE|nr:ABC transporter substrate-binding protein [Anaeromyxobacter dehalogenans]ABC81949.1 amino acid/amide ABC transporter substrate-binding protein, HAAT family [Anaeromyxobacter dehalogenans 2CP-C]
MTKLLGTLLLCALALPARAADTVKIAVTGPFSGGSAPMGSSMRDGAKLAIAEINAAGGIQVGARKLKIEVVERDDEAKNERGALIGQELASMADLAGVIGSVNTGVVMAGDKHLQEKGITKIITPAAGSASMTQWAKGAEGPKTLSIFRFAAHDGIQAAMVVEEAINRKLTKVALLHDSTNYGVSGRDDLLRQIKLQGDKLQVIATEKFNIGDKDMTAQLLRAKAGGAQAILIWGIGPELAVAANGMAKLNIKAPLIGGWTLSMSNYIDNAGKNGNGTLMPQTFIEEPVTPKAKAFIDAYHKAYGVTRIPSPVSAAQGYDAVYLFAAAVKQAGTTDTRKITEALEDLKEPVQGVIATWVHPYKKWDPSNVETHEAFRREQVVMGMVKDGRVVFANESDRARLAKGAQNKM